MEPYGYPDELRAYILHAFGQSPRMTLLEIHHNNPKYSWEVFVDAVGYLVSEGYMEGIGDGFAVQYVLTNKGRSSATPTG